MATLEDLKPDARVEGLVVGSSVDVVAKTWHGPDTLEVVYRTADGVVDTRLLSRSDEPRLSIAAVERHWTLDADGELFKLASEARRIEGLVGGGAPTPGALRNLIWTGDKGTPGIPTPGVPHFLGVIRPRP